MTSAFLQLLPFCLVLFLVQGLATLPWLFALSRQSFRGQLPFYGKVVGGVTACGLLYAFLLESNSDPGIVSLWGRFYMAILTLQIGIDLFILAFYLLLTWWSKEIGRAHV